MVIEGELAWDDKYDVQVMYHRTVPETYIVLLTTVSPINSTEKEIFFN